MSDDWFYETHEGALRFGLKIDEMLLDEQSDFQRVQVFETPLFGRVLALDGLLMTSERDEYNYHEMLVHPALCTAPSIERVLVIGGGDGGTVRELMRYPEVKQVVMVEIDGLVVEASKKYLPSIGSAWDDPRLELIIGDGIEYVREAPAASFDVVLLDGSDPVGPAEGLFDRSFYEGCARVLRPQGVFAQQSESPELFRAVFADVVRTARDVFGQAHPYFGPVPLYISGYWSFTFASRSVDPLALIDARAERVEQHTRRWDRALHRAMFVVPKDVRSALAD
ncbi:MAG: polyamine aminopropyltransferase [Myxococcales bacterium]|nr:polyamine aminopropyltransferase [Myxococcales bacterium]MCB9537601.1 polyamine aminopropyltransferase [Myxococcales bacterium]